MLGDSRGSKGLREGLGRFLFLNPNSSSIHHTTRISTSNTSFHRSISATTAMPPPPASARPAPAKLKSANGANGTNGVPAPKKAAEAEEEGSKRTGKPNQAEYRAEMDGYDKEIAEVKAKLVRLCLISALEVGGPLRSAEHSTLHALSVRS